MVWKWSGKISSLLFFLLFDWGCANTAPRLLSSDWGRQVVAESFEAVRRRQPWTPMILILILISLNKIRLKRLPVISRKHFRKTRTNCYFKYQLLFQNSNTNCIGTSNTNWYFKYQLVLQIPIGTSNTNVLQIPMYFKYQLVLPIPWVTIQQQEQQQQSGYKSHAKVGVLRDSHNFFFLTQKGEFECFWARKEFTRWFLFALKSLNQSLIAASM
jgi:hypothetical protein